MYDAGRIDGRLLVGQYQHCRIGLHENGWSNYALSRAQLFAPVQRTPDPLMTRA